jgi:hypothetical protein
VDLLGAEALHDATFALTEIGARQVATPGEDRSRAWIEQALRRTGLDVAVEPFTFDAWRPGVATLEISSEGPTLDDVPVEALSPTPDADLVLPLRSPSGDFRGGAVLVSSSLGSRADAFFLAAGGGAGALVRITEDLDHDGSPLVEVGHLVAGTTLPSIAVDRATGDALLARLGEDVHLVVHPDVATDHVSHNLVARVPGTGEAPGRIWVVAHYDSWHGAEMAFDNALGAAGLVQLAARSATAGPPAADEVVFLATSGEEQGLRGALAFAEAHDAEIGSRDLVLVLDVMWSAEGDYLALATDDALAAEAIAAAEAEGLVAIDGGDPGLGSDHVPFVARGADAIWLGRWPDRHYHTVADTLDQLDLDEASAALAATWRVLAAHAGWDPR